jgi:hypothetical protein
MSGDNSEKTPLSFSVERSPMTSSAKVARPTERQFGGSMTARIDRAVAAAILGQLVDVAGTKKWPIRPPANTMRGVDFYSATDFVAALTLSAQRFKETHGYLPSLASPTAFNEHQFVRKFFAPLPVPSLADKLAARDYVKARLGGDVLPEVVWVGESVEDLFAARHPSGRFLLKANTGSGTNLILNFPEDLTAKREAITRQATAWLNSRYGFGWGEWYYCAFPPRLFLERFIDFNGDGTPNDYKFFSFNGKVRLINVHSDRHTSHKEGFYDLSWRHLPFVLGVDRRVGRLKGYRYAHEPTECPRPGNLDAMIGVAERIAEGLDFARVDLYSDGINAIKYGEITFVPSNADLPFSDIKFDRWLGSFFEN